MLADNLGFADSIYVDENKSVSAFAALPFERPIGVDEDRVLDNFLTRMKRLGVVSSAVERGRGDYVFPNRLHWLYFTLEAERAKESNEP